MSQTHHTTRELRRDPVLDRWVIIAGERGKRPVEFSSAYDHFAGFYAATDPFAEGNEHLTAPEIYAIRPEGSAADGPGWRVRVVPNKYPALRTEGELNPRKDGLYDRINGVGAHEVVIETPDPYLMMPDMPLSQLVDVFSTYQLRLEALSRDERFAHILVFKNHGQYAGASLRHSHSQIIATPIIPKRVMEELQCSFAYWRERERSVFLDIADQELAARERVVCHDEHTLAFCPFASGFPMEIHVLPKRHGADFRRAGPEEIRSVAATVKSCLLKWRGVLGDTPYNFLIHTAPNDTELSAVAKEFPPLDSFFCWHLEMFPRITRAAGFEWGTGYYINPTPPEEAAELLRAVAVDAH